LGVKLLPFISNSGLILNALVFTVSFGTGWGLRGFLGCKIPVQKYSVVYGRGIACDRRDQVAAARASRVTTSIRSANLTSGMTSRKPARPSRRRRRLASNCTKKLIDLTRLKEGRCLRPCKVFGPNRTKMFHVKHFGTIGAARNEPRLVGLREPAVSPASHFCPFHQTLRQNLIWPTIASKIAGSGKKEAPS